MIDVENAPLIVARIGAYNFTLHGVLLERLYAVTEARSDREKLRISRRDLQQTLLYLFYRGVITAEEVEILQHYRPQRHHAEGTIGKS